MTDHQRLGMTMSNTMLGLYQRSTLRCLAAIISGVFKMDLAAQFVPYRTE